MPIRFPTVQDLPALVEVGRRMHALTNGHLYVGVGASRLVIDGQQADNDFTCFYIETQTKNSQLPIYSFNS